MLSNNREVPTMKYSALLKMLPVIMVLLAGMAIAPVRADDAAWLTECESRCQPLSGEERYRCIQTCLSAKRKAGTTTGRRSGGTYQECSEACSSLSGLEGIRCIRTCMESGSSQQPANPEKNVQKPDAVTACESRCGILTGELKDTCIARCKKEKYNEYRDPLRFNK